MSRSEHAFQNQDSLPCSFPIDKLSTINLFKFSWSTRATHRKTSFSKRGTHQGACIYFKTCFFIRYDMHDYHYMEYNTVSTTVRLSKTVSGSSSSLWRDVIESSHVLRELRLDPAKLDRSASYIERDLWKRAPNIVPLNVWNTPVLKIGKFVVAPWNSKDYIIHVKRGIIWEGNKRRFLLRYSQVEVFVSTICYRNHGKKFLQLSIHLPRPFRIPRFFLLP